MLRLPFEYGYTLNITMSRNRQKARQIYKSPAS